MELGDKRSFCSILLFLSFIMLRSFGTTTGQGRPPEINVPAMFVFGDSLLDNGNNNGLASFAKANYFPYGIDFVAGPTGRFCNGLTMADEIANLLGLPLLPPHSQAWGNSILYGLNYASAAAGILDETGGNFVARIPFNQQIQNFQVTLDELRGILGIGSGELAAEIGRCLFLIGMGSNDYLNNYLLPSFDTRNKYNSEQFAELLVRQFSHQLTSLHDMGARRFAILGVGSLGCTPRIISETTDGRCSEKVEELTGAFNRHVKSMVRTLNTNLPSSRIIYVDIHRMFREVIDNNTSYGFNVRDTGCCGVGKNRGEITCLPFETPCEDRQRYVFWDAFHPTEAVNVMLARRAFSGGTDVAFPMNILQLATAELN